MESETKRKRQPNFSLKEKHDLFNVISMKYSKIIENKSTDKVSMVEKEDTWNLICNDFNSTSETGLFRDKECLKRLYENRKREIRKIMAKNKQEINKTGGGQANKTELDPADELLLSTINIKTVIGLHSPFDSDSVPTKSTPIDKQEEFVLRHQKNKCDFDKDEDLNQNIEYCYDSDENLGGDEVMVSSFVNYKAQTNEQVINEEIEYENDGSIKKINVDRQEENKENRPTFKKASDYKNPKNPALRVPYLVTNKVKEGERQEATTALSRKRGGRKIPSVQPSRRRRGIEILSSSHITEKYNEILDLRKILLLKQIELADQELSFQKIKNKLEIEILTKKNN